MSSEAQFWRYLRAGLSRPALFGHLHLQRIENTAGDGVPDVNGCWHTVDFWVELKYVPSWPARATTPVRLKRYTAEQRRWLRQRGMAGGKAWLLIKVANTVLLFNWLYAQRVGKLTRAQMYQQADVIWEKHVDFHELLRFLTQGGLLVSAR